MYNLIHIVHIIQQVMSRLIFGIRDAENTAEVMVKYFRTDGGGEYEKEPDDHDIICNRWESLTKLRLRTHLSKTALLNV
jgi:hypothetical protein